MTSFDARRAMCPTRQKCTMPSHTPPSFLSRIAIAIGSFFAILGNGRLAADVTRLRAGEALAADAAPQEVRIEVPVEKIVEVRVEVPVETIVEKTVTQRIEIPVEKIVEKTVEVPTPTAALQLLGLLQREARFVDFIQEDVAPYTDAEIGAAARVVHAGCRKVLGEHFTIAPVRPETEGARITLPAMLISVVNLAGYWGAAFWIPTFLTKERGLSVQTMLGFSFVQYAGMFVGFQFFGWLADAIGRRRAMLAAFVACSASIAVYIVVRHPMFLFWWGAIVGFALCGAGGILGAYYAELFPAHLRAYAGGFCWNMGRIGAMLAPFTNGVVGKTHGLQAGLAITSVIYLAGTLLLFLLPETYRPPNPPPTFPNDKGAA